MVNTINFFTKMQKLPCKGTKNILLCQKMCINFSMCCAKYELDKVENEKKWAVICLIGKKIVSLRPNYEKACRIGESLDDFVAVVDIDFGYRHDMVCSLVVSLYSCAKYCGIYLGRYSDRSLSIESGR